MNWATFFLGTEFGVCLVFAFIGVYVRRLWKTNKLGINGKYRDGSS